MDFKDKTIFSLGADCGLGKALAQTALQRDVKRVFARVVAVWTWLCKAREVHVQRRQLANLNERQLQDIGINRAEALREAARPFWDFPESR